LRCFEAGGKQKFDSSEKGDEEAKDLKGKSKHGQRQGRLSRAKRWVSKKVSIVGFENG